MMSATLAARGPSHSMTKWIKVCAFALAGASVWWGLTAVDYERYVTPAVIADWLRGAGPWAPLLLIAGMAGSVVIPPIPSLPLDLAAGATFGPLWGTVYAVIGAEIGAIGCFLLARLLGRDALSKMLKVDAVFCQMCTDHQLMGLVFFARLIPVFSFDLVSYGAGLTNLSLKTFALSTLFGMIPPTFAFTYLGSSVISAQWPLIAAGVAMVVLFLITPKLLAAHRSSAIAQLVLGPPPPAMPPRREIPLMPRCAGCGMALSAAHSSFDLAAAGASAKH